MEVEFSCLFERYSNVRFHEKPSSGSTDVPWGQINGQTYTAKLIAAFRNFANVSDEIKKK